MARLVRSNDCHGHIFAPSANDGSWPSAARGWNNDRNDHRDGRQHDRRRYPQAHAQWKRGGRVPSEYRGRNYVVNDYRAYHLSAPPRGYQWVGVGGDYVLAAIATGLIAQIIVGQ
jgi:Ni/Co efflux regulator RcnB